ncbi:MAG: type II toxin-antitoxin system RelE/ParE family toxin [Cytophagales bacterium]|nr:type II toxin-antitoxin system RelE/ParE family toxin [Cytophaga sp.]
MHYTILINHEAQLDIERAYNYYFETINHTIAELFYNDLQEAYSALSINPFYQIRTKTYRAIPLKKFPFLLFFQVVEEQQKVKILALFNTHQDTNKYPS